MNSKALRKILIFLIAVCITIFYGVSGTFAAACPNGDHDYTVTIEKHATETGDGLRKFVCSDCGHTYTQKIERTGHIWSEWKTTREATCTKDGEQVRTCTKHPDLGHKETRTIKATGHKWGPWIVDRKATRGKDGLKHRVCKNDSSERQTKIISALGDDTTGDNSKITTDDKKSSGKDKKKTDKSGTKTKAKTTARTAAQSTSPSYVSPTATSQRDNEQSQEDADPDADDEDDMDDEPEDDILAGNSGAGAGNGGAGSGAGDGTAGESSAGGSESVPFGTADAVLLGANGAATIFWAVLLLPLIRVMFWIAAKRREKEEEEGAAT